MPRRYWQYSPEFQVLNVLSTAGATIFGCGVRAADGVFPVVDALRQSCGRKSVGRDRIGMDDRISAPTFNFDETPVVTWEAYDYAN